MVRQAAGDNDVRVPIAIEVADGNGVRVRGCCGGDWGLERAVTLTGEDAENTAASRLVVTCDRGNIGFAVPIEIANGDCGNDVAGGKTKGIGNPGLDGAITVAEQDVAAPAGDNENIGFAIAVEPGRPLENPHR